MYPNPRTDDEITSVSSDSQNGNNQTSNFLLAPANSAAFPDLAPCRLTRSMHAFTLVSRWLAAHRRQRQTTICAAGERHELRVCIKRRKHRIYARFHHLFAAYGLIPLILKE